MTDLYTQIANAPLVGTFVKSAGLPVPVELERHSPGDPVIRGRVLLGAAPGGRLAGPAARVLASAGAETATELRDDLRSAAAEGGLDAAVWHPDTAGEDDAFKALVFDATGIASTGDLGELLAFFGPTIRRVETSGRVIVLGTPPGDCATTGEAIAQRALEGFTLSVAKEVRRGATGQLVLVERGAEDGIESTLRFLLSPRSAYVSGQVVRVGRAGSPAVGDWERPLDGRVALVTGASRGIGAAIASVLARDGARVVGLDVPAAADALEAVAANVGGSTLALDVTDPEAPRTIASHLAREHGGADVVVHNAGITRDKTLGRMDEERWSTVIDVNLRAPERITSELLETEGALGDAARIVCVSSISGIAGNAGQTNYATSKAGVIGLVEALAETAAERGTTVNAVAPGFIETEMTAHMPLAAREVGRRMNSLSQGGLPVDVAETIAWLASPASGGVNGNVVRVCGQSLLGA
jgi:3-oxoacyl-[acyl-carrier protein] reductase